MALQIVPDEVRTAGAQAAALASALGDVGLGPSLDVVAIGLPGSTAGPAATRLADSWVSRTCTVAGDVDAYAAGLRSSVDAVDRQEAGNAGVFRRGSGRTDTEGPGGVPRAGW